MSIRRYGAPSFGNFSLNELVNAHCEAYLNLSWTPNVATPFMPTNFEMAYDQFVLVANPKSTHHRPTHKVKALSR